MSSTTWIGGVYGVTTQSGKTAPVVVSDGGQLGTIASSERFKKDIATMDKTSEAILSLRPVTFHYKTDTKDTPQFGLIAEEVAKVNPALVLPDKDGKPYTVRYDQVNAMLLNEFLKEHQTVQQQGATIARLEKQIDALTAGLQKVSAQIEATKFAKDGSAVADLRRKWSRISNSCRQSQQSRLVWATSQRVIPTGERSGLQTHIAETENGRFACG